MYIKNSEVRQIIGVNEASIISESVLQSSIEFAEDEVDRLTNTTYYPIEDSGTVTTLTGTTLSDSSKSWIADSWIGYAVYIYAGTGKGQIREITDNTSTQLTLATWTTDPDTTSKYYITYLNKITETYDGNGLTSLYLRYLPVIQIDSLTIDHTSITPSKIWTYNDTGRIVLMNTAEQPSFSPVSSSSKRQIISITYHYGVLSDIKHNRLDIPGQVKRLCGVIAGLKALVYQIGGTYDDPSTWTLPEVTVSVGQAYINIRSAMDTLYKEYEYLRKEVCDKYVYIA